MAIEDEHADVLQKIEFAITSVHRNEPTLLDVDVIEALMDARVARAALAASDAPGA
jgi:hypothetical protein